MMGIPSRPVAAVATEAVTIVDVETILGDCVSMGGTGGSEEQKR